ncbi:hypothetical protein [Legionella quateirensis]|nr:hypothetical protein [Legionella quateirensis]
MMLFRIIVFSIGCLFNFNTQAYAVTEATPEKAPEYSRELLNLVLNVVKNCYKGPTKTDGIQLVKCVADVFNQDVPNPLHYKLRITGDCPGESDLIIYNPAGDMITCYLEFGQSMQVNRCISYKVPPLSNGQEMSILPPKVLIK